LPAAAPTGDASLAVVGHQRSRQRRVLFFALYTANNVGRFTFVTASAMAFRTQALSCARSRVLIAASGEHTQSQPNRRRRIRGQWRR